MRNITNRHYYFDWIRVIATISVFLIHTLSIFGQVEFQLMNNETSLVYTALTGFIFYWQMPLFFLISGNSSRLSLGSRNNKKYISDRFKRIFIPMLTGIIILALPQDYFEALNKNQFSGNFINFIPFHFNKVIELCKNTKILYSSALFAEFGHHIWFLAFLLIYSFISLPILRSFESRNFDFINRIISKINGPFTMFLPVIPLFLVLTVLRPFDTTYSGWPAFFYWGTYYMIGSVIFHNDKYINIVEKYRFISLIIALISYSLLTLHTIITDFKIFTNPDYSIVSVTGNFLWVVTAWAWINLIIGFSKVHLNFSSTKLKLLRQRAVPFYLLHLPIVLAVGYFIVLLNWNLNFKFLAVSIISFVLTIIPVELFIMRSRRLAFIFGTKKD